MTFFTRSLVNIFRNKTRSLLTMAGIAVGVFAVVLISTVGAAGTAQVSSTLLTMGVDTLLVQASENTAAAVLTESDVDAVKTLGGVADVMPLMASVTEAKMIDRRLDTYVWGVDKSANTLISLEAAHGRLITNADTSARAKVCVIDEAFALETYGRSNVVGKKARIFLGGKFHEFEIVGIAKSGLSSLQNMLSNIMPNFMYIPITTMQSLCGRVTYDKIAVKLSDPNADAAVVRRVTQKLDEIHETTDGYECNSLLSQKQQLDGIMDTVTAALSLVAGISLAVSGITVMTTMMMSVSERSREIGIKKAVGAKRRTICAEFLTESVAMTVLGSAAGIALGLAVSFVGCTALSVPLVLNVRALILSALAAAFIGAVFGAYPAIKASNMRPVECFRS